MKRRRCRGAPPCKNLTRHPIPCHATPFRTQPLGVKRWVWCVGVGLAGPRATMLSSVDGGSLPKVFFGSVIFAGCGVISELGCKGSGTSERYGSEKTRSLLLLYGLLGVSGQTIPREADVMKAAKALAKSSGSTSGPTSGSSPGPTSGSTSSATTGPTSGPTLKVSGTVRSAGFLEAPTVLAKPPPMKTVRSPGRPVHASPKPKDAQWPPPLAKVAAAKYHPPPPKATATAVKSGGCPPKPVPESALTKAGAKYNSPANSTGPAVHGCSSRFFPNVVILQSCHGLLRTYVHAPYVCT